MDIHNQSPDGWIEKKSLFFFRMTFDSIAFFWFCFDGCKPRFACFNSTSFQGHSMRTRSMTMEMYKEISDDEALFCDVSMDGQFQTISSTEILQTWSNKQNQFSYSQSKCPRLLGTKKSFGSENGWTSFSTFPRLDSCKSVENSWSFEEFSGESLSFPPNWNLRRFPFSVPPRLQLTVLFWGRMGRVPPLQSSSDWFQGFPQKRSLSENTLWFWALRNFDETIFPRASSNPSRRCWRKDAFQFSKSLMQRVSQSIKWPLGPFEPKIILLI